jgi:mono/diheme cytochrome c family protein
MIPNLAMLSDARRRAVTRMASVLLLGAMIAAAPAYAQPSAESDYQQLCAHCHGPGGKGDGRAPYVIPGLKPADLTHLSRRNGGRFPSDEVRRAIDGRDEKPFHRLDMPLWGVKLQKSGKEFTPESEAEVKRRIDGLVSYIESIQVK